MTLMPTNCWNTDSRTPIHTIGNKPSAGPLRSAKLDFVSRLRVEPISRIRSSMPVLRMPDSVSLASSVRPTWTRKRGDSGMVVASTP